MSFIERCQDWIKERHGGTVFLTPSATSALEMAVMLLGIGPKDEVIMPSFGFSSCPNSVILRGGIPVFADIDPKTLNLWTKVEDLSPRTKCIMLIHYAGVIGGLPMVKTKFIEDAAHCIASDWRLMGDFGAISFHETKNISCGQGGALLIRDEEMVEKAQILRQCGTTKALVKNAWDWVEVGTQQLMSEVTAEHLWKELQQADEITKKRKAIWQIYHDEIRAERKAVFPANGHIFWFMAAGRERLISNLGRDGILLATHYTPLHNRRPGEKYGRTFGSCAKSIYASEHIVRPPMKVSEDEAFRISRLINEVMQPNAISA